MFRVDFSASARFCLTSLLVFGAVGGFFAGCQSYHAQPLDRAEVDAALAPAPPAEMAARAKGLKHPILKGIQLEPEEGLSADQAAIVAVLASPALKAARDQSAVSGAALLQAGLLPNPQLSYNYDWVTGGNTAGAVNAYGWGLSWDITSLVAYDANVKAAGADLKSTDLSIAWQEWQAAEAAKAAVWDLISIRAQVALVSEIDSRLQDNLTLVHKATDAHLKTSTDLSAAESAAVDSHAALLQMQRDAERQRLALNHLLGLAPDTVVRIRDQDVLPEHLDVPAESALAADVEQHRLDLVALRQGYESQEQTLRAAVLNQFPKINLGFNKASDNTGVHSAGIGVSIDLPLFDRNQGAIAKEKATRQRLFDEYVSRVFDSRADIAQAISDLRAINGQIVDAEAALPKLSQLVDAYKNASERGHADVLSYYAAQNELAQKRVEVLRLRQALADNGIALELAAGRYFPEATSSPVPATQPVATENLRSNKS